MSPKRDEVANLLIVGVGSMAEAECVRKCLKRKVAAA
jgi:hypothetical protein